jgi:hypothetical protein
MVMLPFATTGLAQNALTRPGTSVSCAQNTPATNPYTTANRSASAQAVLSSLASLPEADSLIYINANRILNEALPKLMPEKNVADMRSTLNEIRQTIGVDVTKLEYIVVAVRSRKPSAQLSFMLPELMVVAGGDFSAESLLALARMAAGTKLRDEKYGQKTFALMTIDPVVAEAEKNPLLKSLSEVAIVSLNANTIAAGTTAYVKAAVDAIEGNGRISSESLNSLLRDPTALVSIAGTPLTSFNKSFGLLGTESNPRTPRCDSRFGDFFAAITMDANNILLRGAMNADNADTAKIINSVLSGLLQQATSVADKRAQPVLKSVSITPQDNEIVLRAEIPQQMVLDLIKEQMKPKQEVAAPPKTATPPKKRRVVRRKRSGTGM